MTSVGERLKVERESRKMTLEQMAAATGIGLAYLDALERNAIDELPGKAFGKLYIRAYAEVFAFDPQPWIDDYDREQRLVQGPSTEPTTSAPLGSRPVSEAIARWKAARAAAEQAARVAEKAEPVVVEAAVPETVSEPVSENVVEIAPEPIQEVEPEPEALPEAPAAPAEVIPEATAHIALEPPARVAAGRRFLAPLLILGAVLIAIAIYFAMSGSSGKSERAVPASAPTTSKAPPRVESTPEPRPVELPPPVIAKPQPTPPTTPPVTRSVEAAGELTVTEFGVGRRMVNLRLEGESDHFAPGDRVCFASRVVGGRGGDVIRHVWIYEGRTQQTITLRLGGRDFRTHSNKTLGHAGSWAVEARDGSGRVLARVDFTCLPPVR
jgi:transcriptional regulator with XRE-family HTH domain